MLIDYYRQVVMYRYGGRIHCTRVINYHVFVLHFQDFKAFQYSTCITPDQVPDYLESGRNNVRRLLNYRRLIVLIIHASFTGPVFAFEQLAKSHLQSARRAPLLRTTAGRGA
jgi:hypothetical protein